MTMSKVKDTLDEPCVEVESRLIKLSVNSIMCNVH